MSIVLNELTARDAMLYALRYAGQENPPTFDLTEKGRIDLERYSQALTEAQTREMGS